ncbi:peptide methionine sulfoxide reductase MsrA [Sphingobium sp. SYK-6]|nr:peptide methionine sulfoxide reductase MsrA [Sphingobium sp. SYK-6]
MSGRKPMRSLLAAILLAGQGLALAAFSASAPAAAAERPRLAPVPALDEPETGRNATAYFAGGCFWGVEGVFSHVKGVKRVLSGYGGGPPEMRVTYDRVGTGRTGYAEAVRVIYDPAEVSYGTLLRIFFSVIADPTTLDRQGPDHGTQYRSALFPQSEAQARTAQAYIAQLDESGLWDAPVVTRTEAVRRFQPAEAYHQDFMRKNPDHPYIRRWDAPKLAAFKTLLPALYKPAASP